MRLIELIDLDLELVLTDLESIQVRIDPSFSVIYSGCWWFWEPRKGPDKQLISGIDRARQV